MPFTEKEGIGHFVVKTVYEDEEEIVIKPVVKVEKKETWTLEPDPFASDGSEFYRMHKEGISWKGVMLATKSKNPWVKAKKYAKENDLEYPIKQS
jgi:hypothetical protein